MKERYNNLIYNMLLLVLLTCISTSIFAQGRSVIADAKTKEPVKYAYLQSLETEKWTLSDSLGYFHINSNSGVKAKCMGYKTQIFQRGEVKDTIFLTPKREQLKEVVIGSNKDPKISEYGFHRQTRTWLGRLFHSKNNAIARGSNSGIFQGVYIENPKPKKNTYIKELLVRIRALDENNLVRLHLYSIKENNGNGQIEIDRELLKKNSIVQISSKRGVKSLSVEDQNIKFPENGVLLAVEFFKDNNVIKISRKNTSEGKLSRSYAVYSSKKNQPPHLLHSYANSNETEKHTNFMFGIAVAEY